MVASLVLLLFATVWSGAKNVDIYLNVQEIDMSPEMYHAQCPEVFPVKSEGEYGDDPKWKMRYKYVFIPQPQENLDVNELNRSDYSQRHPEDAIFPENPSKNMFIIFSNSMPDDRIFAWSLK